MRATVVVLGDLGRSPRMCFHAMSLAQHGCKVDFVGYAKTSPPNRLVTHPQVRIINVPEAPAWFRFLPRTLSHGFKLIWTFVLLLATLLFRLGFPDVILLQNPPGVPSLLVCWLVAKLKRARLMVDWHNYTFSILEFEYGRGAGLVRFAESWERALGPKADFALCVTHAMRTDLLKRWGVRAVTLYDRPPEGVFGPLEVEAKHEFFVELAIEKGYTAFLSESSQTEPEAIRGLPELTRFSYRTGPGEPAFLREDRPAIIVSSTSWTADEDFGMLLDALQKYDQLACLQEEWTSGESRLPDVLAVITGKGPLKSFYLERIKERNLGRVRFLTPWLAPDDYPKMLACADLGVSLHLSTSGLDLPMKVVDMFGCGVPVLARRFQCVDELVKEGENGQLFDSAKELADWLLGLLRGFAVQSEEARLQQLSKGLRELPLLSWEDNWDANIWPMLAPFDNK